MNFMEQFYESLRVSKKCVYLQHGNVMPKGNGFYELGIQPSLNAFFFSQEDPKAEGCSSRDPQCSLQESNIILP